MNLDPANDSTNDKCFDIDINDLISITPGILISFITFVTFFTALAVDRLFFQLIDELIFF